MLQSLADNGFYVGITNDVNERLKKHNKGEVKST
ncbi:MAG: GIY-YIG nuclease family protein, partial [Patescibacteria group bacterium]|nr:GIY-YIG nuclease family protein [Patescibacteria group bacterium]